MSELERLKFPVFLLRLSNNSGPLLLDARTIYMFPVFTDVEYAQMFKERMGGNCLVISIGNAEDLRAYIANPPAVVPTNDLDFAIAMDPIDLNTGDFRCFPREWFINALDQLSQTDEL